MSDATSRHVKGMDRNQTLLLPETIGKYIDEDNETRFIDAFVDSLDLHRERRQHRVQRLRRRQEHEPVRV